jgi:hypothetical protein
MDWSGSMSSIARKIRKNAENFMIQDLYKNMTPEQYREGIKLAIERARKDFEEEYRSKFEKLINEYNYNLRDGFGVAIDTISVELLYELAVQMNAFDEEDPDIKSQIIKKVQEIYNNTITAVERYAKFQNDDKAQKEFKKRKQKVMKFFKLK